MNRASRQAHRIDLIVFLGNPGTRYARTRHNAGRLMAESLSDLPITSPWKEKFHGTFARAGEQVLLLPDTYMNESGRSVQAAASFFTIPQDATLVVHDDLETPFGTVHLVFGGGHRGNNGVRSVEQHLGGRDFWRLRVGIGRPPADRPASAWVLERFTPDEEARLPELQRLAARLLRENLADPRERREGIS